MPIDDFAPAAWKERFGLALVRLRPAMTDVRAHQLAEDGYENLGYLSPVAAAQLMASLLPSRPDALDAAPGPT